MKTPKTRITLLCLLGIVAIAVSFTATGRWSVINSSTAQTLSWQDKVDPGVLSAASLGQAEFLVYMNSQADLSGAGALSTKEAKGQFVYQRLTATAQASQPAVQQLLDSLGATYQTFWVTNAIWAKGNLAVVQAVAARPEVAYIYPSGRGRLEVPPAEQPLTSTNAISSTSLVGAAEVGLGIHVDEKLRFYRLGKVKLIADG